MPQGHRPSQKAAGPGSAPPQIWQNPVPTVDAAKIPTAAQVQELKASISSAGVRARNLLRTAWESAATFRRTDFRGGANGARIRLAPQKDWAVNDPSSLGPDSPLSKRSRQSATLPTPSRCRWLISSFSVVAWESRLQRRGDATSEETDAFSLQCVSQ